MSGFRRCLTGVSVIAVLIAIVVGVPTLLSVLIGWPLPYSVPDWSAVASTLGQDGVPDQVLLDAIAIACWALWLVFVLSLGAEIVAALQGRVVRRVAIVTPMQLLAAALVTTVIVSFASGSEPTPVVPIDSYVLNMQPTVAVLPVSSVATTTIDASSTAAPTTISYTVVRRDTLWGISEKHLGDATRWKEIYNLNRDRPQTDGGTLVDVDLIRPGWVLQLPSDAKNALSDFPLMTQRPLVVEVPSVAESQTAPATDEGTQEPNETVEITTTTTAGAVSESGAVRGHVEKRKVTLSSGSVIPMSVLTGLSVAVGVLRLRRRSRRVLDSPSPGLTWSEPLIDSSVREVRRSDLEQQLSVLGISDDIDESYVPARPSSVDMIASAELEARPLDEVRAIVVDAASNPNSEVAIAGARLARELVAVEKGFNGYEVVDEEAAFRKVDEALLARTRVLAEIELNDIAEYRSTCPGEPMPTLVVVFDIDKGVSVGSLRALAVRAQRLDVVLLATQVPASDGTEVDLRSNEGSFSMTLDEAKSVVSVVEASRSDAEVVVAIESEPFVVDASVVAISKPVNVSVFGPVRIVVGSEEIKSGLRGKARELVAFLALRPQGATWDVIGAALWPEANGKQTNERFRTTLSNLRSTLRSSTAADSKFVDLIGERYVLDSSQFDCDVWRFQSALADAVSGGNDIQGALARVAESYDGELAEGSYYEWAEAPREDLRRRALDALGRLAELQQRDGNMTAALSSLERAIAIDPYSEAIYQRIMTVQSDLGHPDAVLRTFRMLERRLNEIDAEPTEKTMAILRDPAA